MTDDNNAIEPQQHRNPESLKESVDAIVDQVSGLIHDVVNFPTDLPEAKLQLAVVGLDAALSAPMPGSNMTTAQLAGAYMLGKGLTFEQAARALGISEGQLYYWDRSVAGFRNEIRYWREKMETDIEAQLYTTIREMANNIGDMDAREQVKLLGLMQKVAGLPEVRARWAAEYQLKREQVTIQKQVADAQKKLASGIPGEKDPRVSEIIERAGRDVYDGVIDVDVSPDDFEDL